MQPCTTLTPTPTCSQLHVGCASRLLHGTIQHVCRSNRLDTQRLNTHSQASTGRLGVRHLRLLLRQLLLRHLQQLLLRQHLKTTLVHLAPQPPDLLPQLLCLLLVCLGLSLWTAERGGALRVQQHGRQADRQTDKQAAVTLFMVSPVL